MDNFLIVQIFKSERSLIEKTQSEQFGQSILRMDVMEETLIGRQFQHHIDHVVDLQTIEELDDVGMIESFVQLDFVSEIFAIEFRNFENVHGFKSEFFVQSFVQHPNDLRIGALSESLVRVEELQILQRFKHRL